MLNKIKSYQSFLNHKSIAYDDENGIFGTAGPTYVGRSHLEKLFKRLGTEKDDVTMAKKLSEHSHLYVKNQDRQR